MATQRERVQRPDKQTSFSHHIATRSHASTIDRLHGISDNARADTTGREASGGSLAQLAAMVQRASARPQKPNVTGLPDTMKANAEARSGLSLDDVRVHYGSSKPAQLNAHAYAAGSQIHIGPGRTRHLAHELWHVVQQKRSQVRPTTKVNGVAVNDDKRLEADADRMGRQLESAPVPMASPSRALTPHQRVVQRDETDGKGDAKGGPTKGDIETGVKELEKRNKDMIFDRMRQYHAHRSGVQAHFTTWPGHIFQFFFKQSLFRTKLGLFLGAGGILTGSLMRRARWASKVKPPVSPGGHTYPADSIAENKVLEQKARSKAAGKK